MAALTEGVYTGHFILSEAPGTISRDTVVVTVAATTTLPPGMVLARLTATGKFVPYNDAGAGGAEIARAVLYADLRNTTGAPADFAGVVVHRIAEVRKADLNWNAQAAPAIAAGLVDLETRSIIGRD